MRPSNTMANSTVLYVDDEENDIFFMELAFKRVGLDQSLHSVTDGQKAIAYLAGDGPYADRAQYPLPALVLLDLNLPLTSGFEVLQWLRKQSELECMPVIVFSSSGRPEDRQKAHELGANQYVLKPASGMEFCDIVQEFYHRWIIPKAGGQR
jgi:CheY-like chemotaxis protein